MKHFLSVVGPAGLGLVTSLGAGFAILLACGIFQILVPIHPPTAGGYLGQGNQNFRAVILYAAAGGCHTLACIFGTMFLIVRLKAEEPRFEFVKIAIGIVISFSIIIGISFLACYFNLAVVEQSYHETMRPLLGDLRFGFLLAKFKIYFLNVGLEPFALVPLSFVIFGVAFSVVACFWAAHQAADFVNKASDIQKKEIVQLKSEIAQLMSLLSIIFTTSCISTIAFLQLGRDWIVKGNTRDAYIQNGYAMSIFWSACFTIIMLTIVLIPLFWVGRHTLHIRRQVKFSGKRPNFYDPFYEVFSYSFFSKAAAATLMPILTSSFAAVIGS